MKSGIIQESVRLRQHVEEIRSLQAQLDHSENKLKHSRYFLIDIANAFDELEATLTGSKGKDNLNSSLLFFETIEKFTDELDIEYGVPELCTTK